ASNRRRRVVPCNFWNVAQCGGTTGWRARLVPIRRCQVARAVSRIHSRRWINGGVKLTSTDPGHFRNTCRHVDGQSLGSRYHIKVTIGGTVIAAGSANRLPLCISFLRPLLHGENKTAKVSFAVSKADTYDWRGCGVVLDRVLQCIKCVLRPF